MKLRIVISALALGLSLCVACRAADPQIQSFEVRLGTLEINTDPQKRFIFRMGGKQEVFNVSTEAFLSGSGTRFPGLPNLQEIGFRSKSGKIFEYGNIAKNIFIERFTKEHPGEAAETLVFEGTTGQRLEIKLKGKTSVYRVDLKIAGREVTLWSSAPTKSADTAESAK